jgi:hypothetical protein
MDFWSVVFVAYLIVTVFAVAMTYREQRQIGQKSVVYNVIGYVACTFWPLVVAVILMSLRLRTG